MTDDRTSISKARTAVDAGEFWDEHDLGGYWRQTRPVELEVELDEARLVLTLEADLARRSAGIA